ncbi:hypothetical protein SUGI_1140090 [Cryptomeria japonica]|nr:hypothetical protein SUGI_1140090 [Cryptomeria japonica]
MSRKYQEANRERCQEEVFEVDLTSEAEEERGLWSEHALIGRVVEPRKTRATIREWISKNWGMRLIVKFIPRNFFIVPWVPNFDPVLLAIYDRPMWIRMYNLPKEYWGENCLEKIGRSLGTLLEIDKELNQKDSYVYARLMIAAVKEIPPQISLVSSTGVWLQQKDPILEEKVAPTEKEPIKIIPNENAGFPKSDPVDLNPVIKEDNQIPLTSNSEYEDDLNPEEADIEDGMEDLDSRCISQSANIMLGRAKGSRGRRSHKQVREERALKKGIVNVFDFMKKSKGGDLSLGER